MSEDFILPSCLVIFLCLMICPLIYNINHIQQVGHNKATAHITCYSDKQVIYNAFVKDLTYSNNRYTFTREDTGVKITVNGNCVVEE